jgi:D-cysteine desulfhydrase
LPGNAEKSEIVAAQRMEVLCIGAMRRLGEEIAAESRSHDIVARTMASASHPGSRLQRFASSLPPRLKLADLPTPVERAVWADVPGCEIWIKRDDRTSVQYGGGKVRKLEWVLADLRLRAAPWVVSAGATGSHHLLALSIFLQQQDQRMAAFVFRQPVTANVSRNFAALVSSGAVIWPMRSRLELPFQWLHRALLPGSFRGWHYVDAGASSAQGSLGFVEAGLELADQIETGVMPKPDCIVIAAGSAGSCAGLAIGMGLAKIPVRIVAVATVESVFFNFPLWQRKLRQIWRELSRCGLDCEGKNEPVDRWLRSRGITLDIDHAEVGSGYGAGTNHTDLAIKLATAHGLKLEQTYTAKAFAARDQGQYLRNASASSSRVLYWHTHNAAPLNGRIVSDWRQRAPRELLIGMDEPFDT